MQAGGLRCLKRQTHKIQEVSASVLLEETRKRNRKFWPDSWPTSMRSACLPYTHGVLLLESSHIVLSTCWSPHCPRQSLPAGCSEAPFSWLVPECWGAGRHQCFGLASEVCEWPMGCLGWPRSWAREKQRLWEQHCIAQHLFPFCQAQAGSLLLSCPPAVAPEEQHSSHCALQQTLKVGQVTGNSVRSVSLTTCTILPRRPVSGNSSITHTALAYVLSSSLPSRSGTGTQTQACGLSLTELQSTRSRVYHTLHGCYIIGSYGRRNWSQHRTNA